MVGARWKRAAQESEAVMQVLCASNRVIPDYAAFRKLSYDADPSLDAAVDEVKAELCAP